MNLMNKMFQVLQYKIWRRQKGPGDLFLCALIIALAIVYAAFFPFLAKAFGATVRLVPILYLAIAALAWGLNGALLASLLNTVLVVSLHKYHGYVFEGGILGPLGSLFVASLVGMLSDMVRQLDREVEERKRAETNVEERERRYRTIFNAISEGIFIVDSQFHIVEINDAAMQIFDHHRAEPAGAPPTRLIHPDFTDELVRFAEAIDSSGYYEGEAIGLSKPEGQIYMAIRGSRIRLEDKDLYFAIIRDVTQTVEANRELRESEEKYRQLFDMESDGLFLIDSETLQVIAANASAVKLYGYSREELLDLRASDLSAEPKATQYAVGHGIRHIPARHHKKKDGTVFTVEITTRHFAWRGKKVHVSAVRDITLRLKGEEDRRRLEAQFHEAQKMESIGTLAGGIAHDFNNLLMSIMGNATLALMLMEPDAPGFSHINNIKRIAKSAAELTKQLLGFARGGKYEPKPTDLNDLMEHHRRMFARTCKNISLQAAYADNLWRVEVDRGQIEQVLLNILVNAQQAMPEGGEIHLETKNVILDDEAPLPFPFKRGAYAHLSIEDTGIGMDEATQKRIFEPFFTTKERGRGTGLGMASVYGIVKNHGGYVHVVSQLGKGTTVLLFFPSTEKELPEELKPQIEKISKGAGTILLVDDEDMIIEITRDMIKLLGYKVLVAKSGQEALELYKEKHAKIDMVILDVVMPNMGGKETFERLKLINPGIKVLVSTGYNLNEKAADILSQGGKDFLQKPFDLSELSVKIEEILASP
jgi:two-component system, cell cycle sensor histidine kinase and response regulator CckA